MNIIKPSRRGFITGLASLMVVPAIVRVENIMPVKAVKNLTVEEIAIQAEKIFAGMYKITGISVNEFYVHNKDLNSNSILTTIKPIKGFEIGQIITFNGFEII